MVQFCGTESTLSVAARPTLAFTAVFPTELRAPELTPLGSADPQMCIGLDNAPAAGDIEFISVFAELSIDRPVVPMVADDPVPEAMLEAMPEAPEAEVRAAVDDVTPDTEDTGVVVVVDAVAVPAVDARPVTELDAATELSGAELVDSAEVSGVVATDVSGETVWALDPADVLATCASAAAWPAVAVSVVVGGGKANGDKVDAAAAAP